MRKVLVTGAGGFIGRYAIEPLNERGFEVHAVTSRTSPPVSSNCRWHTANLLDPLQVENLVQTVKPSHLLHFAWYAIPGKYWTSEENFLWVQSSLELLRRFRECGGQRVVMAGTCAEYDWNYGYCSEFVTPRNPVSSYGICKNALQEMLRVYSEITKINSAWGRIFFLFGSGEQPSRLVPSVVRSLLNGKPTLCSHGNQIRDFLYVRDVADAFVALLESEVTGSVNIASGQPITIKEIVYKVTNKIGETDLIQFGTIPTPKEEPHLLVADISRLCNEVGWSPKYGLNQGIQETINWWKNRLNQEGQ